MSGSWGPDWSAGLTEAQRRAVEHDDGPLMVLAGPGTGKTRVITRRVAHLIRERGVRPESVLAVTFTVKAAGELRSRLIDLIGPDADVVQAYTLHGLGYRIVRRFGDMAGVQMARHPRDGRPMLADDAVQLRTLRRIVREHGLLTPDRAQGASGAAEYALAVRKELCNAGRSIASALETCAKARAALEQGRGLDGAAIAEPELAGERARWARFEEACRAGQLMDREFRARGMLTLDDLIGVASAVLRSSADARAILCSEVRHVVVDEFQDVNVGQIEMLELVAPPEGPGRSRPDLCVVGDDDQSIYGFRGADEFAFERFVSTWGRAGKSSARPLGVERIDLSDNFRSTPAIVRVAGGVIGRATSRFAPDKVVRPGKAGTTPGHVEVVHLGDDSESASAIAAMIVLARQDDPALDLSRIAVIANTRVELARARAALEIEGVPTVMLSAVPIPDEGVQDVLEWAELLTSPEQVSSLERLLIRPPMCVDPSAVGEIARGYRSARARHLDGDEHAPDPGGCARWLAGVADGSVMAPARVREAARAAGVERFVRVHQALESAAVRMPACEAVREIVALSGAVHADLLTPRQRSERVRALVDLVNLAIERQATLDAPGRLGEFLVDYRDMDENRRSPSGLGDGEDARVDGSEGDDTDERVGVRLVTAHGSKGLEFDTVFVPRVSPTHGYGSTKSRGESPVPRGLERRIEGMKDVAEKERLQGEARRLFYVACTRAERRLVLLAKKNKTRSTSMHLLQEILRDAGVKNVLRESEIAELLEKAAVAGMRRARASDEAKLDGLERLDGSPPTRERVFATALSDARQDAARWLARAQDATGERPQEAEAQLAQAARRVAALEHAQRTGACPAWLDDAERGPVERALTLAAQAVDSGGAATAASLVLTPPKGPLRLSATAVGDYETCPRCYYVKHVLGLDEDPSPHRALGEMAHEALERFARAVQHADAEGLTPPGLDRLMTMGRSVFFDRTRGSEHDPEQLDRLLAQLRITFERLHDPSAHVLEIERRVRAEFHGHTLLGTIDRIEQVSLPDGATGLRIVDYKTGNTKIKATADDLQLGVYTLLARHVFPDAALRGRAEYWRLATGERMGIDLEAIDLEAVEARVLKAAQGIASGAFPRACAKGVCSVLERDPGVLTWARGGGGAGRGVGAGEAESAWPGPQPGDDDGL